MRFLGRGNCKYVIQVRRRFLKVGNAYPLKAVICMMLRSRSTAIESDVDISPPLFGWDVNWCNNDAASVCGLAARAVAIS